MTALYLKAVIGLFGALGVGGGFYFLYHSISNWLSEQKKDAETAHEISALKAQRDVNITSVADADRLWDNIKD